MKNLAVSVVLAVLAACSSSSNDGRGAAPRENPVEQALDRKQAAACDLYCPRATTCAFEDAKAELSEKEYAELAADPRIGQENTRQCLAQCKGEWKLSERQVNILGQCSQAQSVCSEFVACTDAVTTPQAATPAAAPQP